MAPRRKSKPDPRHVENRYDAAGQGRRTKGWAAPSSGPNRATSGLQIMRNRADDSIRNDWGAESGVQKWSTNLVGTGITPRWASTSITKLFKRWSPMADADGVLDYFGLQALVVRGWIGKGEIFARRRPRPLGMRLPAPVQVQLLEAEFVPVFDAEKWPGMPDGHVIRQGIEFTRFGERAAYWMYRDHPGERPLSPTPELLLRISARDVRHVFEQKRAGQIRGVTNLAPVMLRLRSSADLEDAVADRQKLANLFTMFITRTLPPELAQNIEFDSVTGLPKFWDGDGTPMVGLEPGMAYELQPGEDVKFANPPGAPADMPAYMRQTGLGTAAGQGLPYELWSGDIKDVSDRTMRVVINEFRRFAEQRQWHTLIPQFCQGVIEWFVDAAVLAGEIPLSEREDARQPEHSPHGWAYIHPVQDVEGKIKAIDAGLTSRDREISRQGEDPVKVDEERAAAQKRAKALGLDAPPPAPGGPQPGAQPPQPQPQQHDALLAVVASISQAFQAAMTQVIQAVATIRPEASGGSQPVQIHNHLPAPGVVVNNAAPIVNVEPTPVQVNNEAPIVNVEPTPVQINNEAPIVNVAPTPVQITNEVPPAEVTVNLPARQTETVLTRDSSGEIVKSVATERTLQ